MLLRAFVTTGFWPVMIAISAAAVSITLTVFRSHPEAMFTYDLGELGTCITFRYPNFSSARNDLRLVLSCSLAISDHPIRRYGEVSFHFFWLEDVPAPLAERLRFARPVDRPSRSGRLVASLSHMTRTLE